MPDGAEVPPSTNVDKPPFDPSRSSSYYDGFNSCWNNLFIPLWESAFIKGYNSYTSSGFMGIVPPISSDVSGSDLSGSDLSGKNIAPTINVTNDEEVEPTIIDEDEEGNVIYTAEEDDGNPEELQEQQVSEQNLNS